MDEDATHMHIQLRGGTTGACCRVHACSAAVLPGRATTMSPCARRHCSGMHLLEQALGGAGDRRRRERLGALLAFVVRVRRHDLLPRPVQVLRRLRDAPLFTRLHATCARSCEHSSELLWQPQTPCGRAIAPAEAVRHQQHVNNRNESSLRRASPDRAAARLRGRELHAELPGGARVEVVDDVVHLRVVAPALAVRDDPRAPALALPVPPAGGPARQAPAVLLSALLSLLPKGSGRGSGH
jgi:hypothetical protein